jgi:hypothetical protein
MHFLLILYVIEYDLYKPRGMLFQDIQPRVNTTQLHM